MVCLCSIHFKLFVCLFIYVSFPLVSRMFLFYVSSPVSLSACLFPFLSPSFSLSSLACSPPSLPYVSSPLSLSLCLFPSAFFHPSHISLLLCRSPFSLPLCLFPSDYTPLSPISVSFTLAQSSVFSPPSLLYVSYSLVCFSLTVSLCFAFFRTLFWWEEGDLAK